MIDKTGPVTTSTNPAPRDDRVAAQSGAQSGSPRPSATAQSTPSATLPAATMLSTATAQLSALRNQATAAAATGNLGDLRHLAERAVAVGVAAGASAENLAGEIAAKLAGATQDQTKHAAPSSVGQTTAAANRSALGLDPVVITQLFDPKQASDAAIAATSDAPPSQLTAATSLNMIASLNFRAGSVITEARGLLASMNAAIKDTAGPGGGPTLTSNSTLGEQEAVSLDGLAELLDQAESSMAAHIVAASRQIGGASTAAASISSDRETTSTSPSLDLKA
jgi:hypothetical protein